MKIHVIHECLTNNNWKAFLREIDTDLFLYVIRIELDDDDNHHNKDYDRDHDYNCRHNKDHADRKDNLEIGRSKQMTSIISSKDSKNGKSNNNWADGLLG